MNGKGEETMARLTPTTAALLHDEKSEPSIIHFIPSGYKGYLLMIREDPSDESESCRRINYEEFKKLTGMKKIPFYLIRRIK